MQGPLGERGTALSRLLAAGVIASVLVALGVIWILTSGTPSRETFRETAGAERNEGRGAGGGETLGGAMPSETRAPSTPGGFDERREGAGEALEPEAPDGSGKERGLVSDQGAAVAHGKGSERAEAGGTAFLELEVLGDGGRGVEGVAVELRSRAVRRTARTGPDGLAFFGDLAPGSYDIVLAGGPCTFQSAAPIELRPGEERRVLLRWGSFDRRIEGRVLLRSGTPLEGVEVTALPIASERSEAVLLPQAQGEACSWRTVTGPEGRFRISGLREGDYELRTAPGGRLPSARTVVRAGELEALLTVDEAEVLLLYGRVVAEDGLPVPGVLVSVLGVQGAVATTGEDGGYELEILLDGRERTYAVSYEREGFRPVRRHVRGMDAAADGTLELNVRLERSRERVPVSGTLVTSEGQPVPGETVYLESTPYARRDRAVTDADGRFLMPDVEIGSGYRLWVYPTGPYRDLRMSGLTIAPPGVELELVLEPLGRAELSGRVENAAGTPLSHFSLWVRSADAAAKAVRLATDAQGVFGPLEVPAGEITVETRSLPRLVVRGIRLEDGESRDVVLVVDWGDFELEGTVVDEAGRGLPGAYVHLYWTHRAGGLTSNSYRQARTDESGRYAFSRLGPGRHRLRVLAAGYESRELEVEPDREVEAIVLQPARR